jgi:hypothetical protein
MVWAIVDARAGVVIRRLRLRLLAVLASVAVMARFSGSGVLPDGAGRVGLVAAIRG